MKPVLIVRADGGSQIGLGHLVRSMALAHAWAREGGDVVLATTAAASDIPASVSPESFPLVNVGWAHPHPHDADAMNRLIQRTPGAWVSCDGYHFDAAYTRRLRDAGARVLVIDDGAQGPSYHADVLVNPNHDAAALRYRFEIETAALVGTDYALLPPAFESWAAWVRQARSPIERVVIALGGGDPGTLGLRVIDACAPVLRRLGIRAAVLAAPGRTTSAWQEIASRCGNVDMDVVSNTPDVARMFADADVGISAAGSTAWQMCFMQLPSVLISIAGNQEPVAAALAGRACAINLGPAKTFSADALSAALQELASDGPRRHRMGAAGRALVDGRGAGRVVDHLRQYTLLS